MKKNKSLYHIINNLYVQVKIFITGSISLFIILLFSKIKNTDNREKQLLCINTEKLGDLLLASDFLFSLGNNGNYNQKYIVIQDNYLSLYNWGKLGFRPIVFNKISYKYNLIYRIKFILQLRQITFSLVINITPERGWINEELSLVASTNERICLKEKSRYLSPVLINCFNKRYTNIKKYSILNEYEILKSFLRELNIYGQKVFDIFNISTGEKVKDILAEINGQKYICVAPFASGKIKSWNLDNYFEILEKYNDKYQIIILGNRTEIEKFKKRHGRVKNVINKYFSFTDTVAIIKKTSVFLGNDSGLTHIAHNIEISTVAIIGGGEYGYYFPYKKNPKTIYYYHHLDCFGCHWDCIYKERYCLKYVRVDEVIKGINSFLVLNDIKK